MGITTLAPDFLGPTSWDRLPGTDGPQALECPPARDSRAAPAGLVRDGRGGHAAVCAMESAICRRIPRSSCASNSAKADIS